MAADWTFVLADHTGKALADVRAPLTLSYLRDRYAEVTFDVDLLDEVADELRAALRNGIPRLKCYRNGALRAYGLWTPMREQEDDEQGDTLSATFRDPLGAVLPFRFTAPTVTFTQQDAGGIAWSLVTTTEAESPTHLRLGAIEPTVLRDRTYENKQVAEAITQLTEVIDGFDFYVDPVDEDDVVGAFHVVASQGVDNAGAVFAHGDGTAANVRAARRFTYLPVNRARVLGEDGLYGEREDAASIDKWGLYAVVQSATDGTVEQPTLDAKAQSLLRADPVTVVEFTPDPDVAPQPWDDYWVGDRVPFQSSTLDIDTTVRVNGIDIVIDEDGNEAEHRLAFEEEVTAA